jgi:RES domain-containing protein
VLLVLKEWLLTVALQRCLNPLDEPSLHAIDTLVQMVESAMLSSFSGFSYRVIADKWRDAPLSAMGAMQHGGRYNAPHSFPVLYGADSQLTALLEAEALFTTADGQLQGMPRDPDPILTIACRLDRVLDLRVPALYYVLGTSQPELVSSTPSRFILNARGEQTSTQQLGAACSDSRRISTLMAPSAVHPSGFCLDILIGSLVDGEQISIRDQSGRIRAEIRGMIRRPRAL